MTCASIQLEEVMTASALTLICRARQSVITYHDEGASLPDYIALPVSQYVLIDLPMGGVLERIGSDLFEISVPKLELAGVWVRPIVKCLVRYL